MINKITLVGNLGADPELKTLENGTAVCRLSIATADNYKDKTGEWQKQTEWHSVTLWRELAERAGQYLKKGNLVYIEGKVTYQKYTDSAGVEKYKTDIVANVCRSLERKEQGEQQAQQEQPKRQEPPRIEQGKGNFDDLPF
jgi:single-strand DNA-binding protein